MAPVRMRVGDLLVEAKLITQSQMESVAAIQKQPGNEGKKIGWLLVDLGIITEEQLLEVLRRNLNTEIVRLHGVQISDKVRQMIPEALAREKQVFPYKLQGNTLYIATADPLDYETLNQIGTAAGCAVEAVIATRGDISDSINRVYSKASIDTMAGVLDSTVLAREAAEQLNNLELDELESRVDSVPVVRFINNLINQAHSKRASDIHIEPLPDSVRVRFRIDGELVEVIRMNKKTHSSIVTRVKIMSDMDIAEKRLPLDGRFQLTIDNSEVSIRAASMPTIYGEKIVLRIMTDDKRGIQPLEDLGITEEHSTMLRHAIKSPNGLLLVTGPTGSGKSTTLYSLLNELSEVHTNVLTIEDPVEKAVPGANQTQVNTKAGLTFASGLRAILRQDPDKIMIGEIRDSETADIAARAAITGHFVLASLHTNSAAAAYMRIVDMGIEPYVVASSVVMVVAQRLVRMICPYCKQEYKPTQADIAFLSQINVELNDRPLYKGKGCERCDHTGHLGRTAVMEVIPTDYKLRDMIVEKAKSADIEDYLTKQKNQRYMLDNAVDLVFAGKVTIHELLNLTQILE